jgi:hypothetical protein
MKKRILIIIFILILLLSSCTETTKIDDITTIDGYSSLDLLQYSPKYDLYETVGDRTGTFLNSMVYEKILEYEYNNFKFLIFKTYDGCILFAGGTDLYFEIFGYINESGEEYLYPLENIKIDEFQNVLGHDGIIISYNNGANSRVIIYFTCGNNGIQPLAECNKSNYEVDITGDGINDLISWQNSQIHIIYLLNGKLYTVDVAELINTEVLNKELNLNMIGCYYNDENNKFYVGGRNDENQIEVEAFVKNCILYYKY